MVLALLGSLIGFVFAAPGAVYIQPQVKKGFAWTIHRLTKKEFGLIAAAGPVINILFGFVFVYIIPYFPNYNSIIYLAARFSFFLALFNMLPFGPLDGAKVSDWSWAAWATIVVAGGLGFYLLI